MATNIVTDWLRFLDLEEYSTGFLENGYDDMETVKQISLADLLAIGVARADHQEYLLSSVRILREQGAAWVYLVVSQQNNPSLEVEDKQEPSTTYYGSDGSSCLQSDETYSSSSSTERSRQPAGPLHSYTDMSGTKRILLNVEVTPDLSHRPEVRPAMQRRTGVQQRSGRSTRSEDDILTEESESVCPERSGKRSLFSQLGQWLCQASPESLTANDGCQPGCRSPPVISLPAPGDVQYRLQYTPLTDRVRRGGGADPSTGGQTVGRHVKLWTPLVAHKQYSSTMGERREHKVNTSIRLCHHLGRGSESQV